MPTLSLRSCRRTPQAGHPQRRPWLSGQHSFSALHHLQLCRLGSVCSILWKHDRKSSWIRNRKRKRFENWEFSSAVFTEHEFPFTGGFLTYSRKRCVEKLAFSARLSCSCELLLEPRTRASPATHSERLHVTSLPCPAHTAAVSSVSAYTETHAGARAIICYSLIEALLTRRGCLRQLQPFWWSSEQENLLHRAVFSKAHLTLTSNPMSIFCTTCLEVRLKRSPFSSYGEIATERIPWVTMKPF